MRKITLFIISLVAFDVHSFDDKKPHFYKEREKGWFWHEIQPEKPDESEKDKPLQPANAEMLSTEKVTLDVKWLKENIDTLMTNAINRPTPENLAAYAYAQRLMLDMGSRFSTKMTQFIALEEALDESSRRPMAQFAINSFKKERTMSIRDVFKKVNKRSGIWFFFTSDCEYCIKQVPVMRQLKAQYDVDILAVSLDGGILPGMEGFDVIPDIGRTVADQFSVEYTPSLFLVDNQTAEVVKMVEGLHSLPDIENRMMLIARNKDFISDDEFLLTQGVRELNIYKNSNGEIVAEKERLDQDAGYLADLLKEKLKEVEPYGALRILPTTKNELMPSNNRKENKP